MEKQSHQIGERRRKPRHQIGTDIKYRIPGMTDFEPGVLHNLSPQGVFISIYCDITAAEHIQILLPGDDPTRDPTQLLVTVIRKEPFTTRIGELGYACRVERIYDPDNSLQRHGVAVGRR